MNALVNDQLGRLRGIFGDPRTANLFKKWAGRPARFARYTSRTPYAGVRTRKADQRKLKPFEEFYVDIERKAKGAASEEQQQAERLLKELKKRGKWPAKSDLVAITLPDDVELIARYEVQATPPDLLHQAPRARRATVRIGWRRILGQTLLLLSMTAALRASRYQGATRILLVSSSFFEQRLVK